MSERWLLREPGSSNRDIFDSALLLKGLSVEPTWVSVNSQALIRAAAENLGLTVLPRILVRRELETGVLAVVEVEGLSLLGTCQLMVHRDKPPAGAVKRLQELLFQEAEERGL